MVTAGVFAVAGLVSGLMVEYLLRRRGDVLVDVQSWRGGTRGSRTEMRSFDAAFFNNKDINISLWSPRVEFFKGGERVASITPRVGTMGQSGAIDLPSRITVEKTLSVDAGREQLDLLRSADRVEFVANVVPKGPFMQKRIMEALKTWDDL